MASNLAGALVALVGLVGVLTGCALLLAPGRIAGMFGLTVKDRQAALYARFVGIRNFATGALSLWAAYALILARVPYATALALALSVLWAVVLGFDMVEYARIGSRPGVVMAGVVAGAALVAALSLGFSG